MKNHTTFVLPLIPQKALKSLGIQCFRQIPPDGTKGNIPVFLKLKLMPYIPTFILRLIMWSYLKLLKSVPFKIIQKCQTLRLHRFRIYQSPHYTNLGKISFSSSYNLNLKLLNFEETLAS